jgi:hypothetical protein
MAVLATQANAIRAMRAKAVFMVLRLVRMRNNRCVNVGYAQALVMPCHCALFV